MSNLKADPLPPPQATPYSNLHLQEFENYEEGQGFNSVTQQKIIEYQIQNPKIYKSGPTKY